MKLNRRLNQVDSVASFMRLDSLENDEPFFTQLFRNDNKPAMTVSTSYSFLYILLAAG